MLFVKKMERERNTNIGTLIVIAGASGAGKDTVMDEFLKHPIVSENKIERVITCTDRVIRDGESPNSYHFLSCEELDLLDKNGQLVEEITQTGTSRKATSKTEIARLFSGENLIWRIDPSRAAEIAKGDFFDKNFPDDAQLLKEHTLVFCINAPKEVIETRRKEREKDKYKKEEFTLRDAQEKPHLKVLFEKAIVVENLDGKLSEAVEKIANSIATHHNKIHKS